MVFLGKIFKKKKKPEIDSKTVKAEDKRTLHEMDKKVGVESPADKRVIVGVIERPYITEKTSAGAGKGTYVFVVSRYANKVTVRKAVESRYGVQASSVRIVNVPGKERRRGRQIGWKPGYKKAIVTLKEGQSIELT